MKSAILFLVIGASSAVSQTVLFHESFSNPLYSDSTWYDGHFITTTTEHPPAATHAAEYHFKKGSSTAVAGGGPRHLFAPSDSVYIKYSVKYGANWVGSQLPYHPHEFSVLTNEDNKYIGPADTHLTTYVEENEGTPLLSIQDGLNIDESHIGQNMSAISEQRAVAGCNGSSDSYPAGDCYVYNTAGNHLNGKVWKAPMKTFTDSAGPYFKNDWHTVEAVFILNSIVGGIAVPDGVIQYWFDGVPLIDHHDVMLRTGAHPTMKFNQFFVGPYIGGTSSNPGSPIDQTVWYGDLTVATRRIVDSTTSVTLSRSVAPLRPAIVCHPNPILTGGPLVIAVEGAREGYVRLTDVLGREVWRSEIIFGQTKYECRTGAIPPGTYWCSVHSVAHVDGKIVQVLH